jgi:PmbA protein
VSELDEIVARIVSGAQGNEEVEAFAARGTETDVRVYEGAIESLSTATSAGVGIRILLESDEGARAGFAWAGSLDDAAIVRAVGQARENAQFAAPDPFVAFAAPDGVAPSDVCVEANDFGAFSVDEKIAMAIELEAQTRQGDPRIRQVDSADYGDAIVESAIASTRGVATHSARTSAYISVSSLAGDDAETQTGSGFSIGRSPADLDLADAAHQAIDRSVRMLGATKIESRKTVVVFDPRVASTLLSVVAGALSGEAVVKGRSFFEGRLGESVAVPGLTLLDDPTDARAYSAARFDGEGLACRRNVLIRDGILERFVYDTVAARRAGTTSTGSAVRGGFAGTPGAGCRAVIVEPGPMQPEEIVAMVGDGVYVQSITGVHSGVSPVSGDFSVGAEGLLIRNGALAEPFREVTVASTLQKMLQSIVAIGSDQTWLPGVACGQTLAIGEFQLSGS